MCENLAEQGFHIIMVARNLKKMQEKAEELQKNLAGRKVDIKFIVADFGELHSIDQYRALLEENTKGLDVGVVIANAGMCNPGYYQWADDKIL